MEPVCFLWTALLYYNDRQLWKRIHLLRFERDEKKAETNYRKHGVSFDEGESVFDDTLSASHKDFKHSLTEDRWLIIGRSDFERLIIVSFT